jgi:hypothetical protein
MSIASFLDGVIPEKMSSAFVLDLDDPEIRIESALPRQISRRLRAARGLRA